MLFLNAKNDVAEERNGKQYPWGGNDLLKHWDSKKYVNVKNPVSK